MMPVMPQLDGQNERPDHHKPHDLLQPEVEQPPRLAGPQAEKGEETEYVGRAEQASQ